MLRQLSFSESNSEIVEYYIYLVTFIFQITVINVLQNLYNLKNSIIGSFNFQNH